MKGQIWGVLAVVGLLALACGEPQDLSRTNSTPSAVGDLAEWPDIETQSVHCAVSYPDDLGRRPVAFDGTIEAVELQPYDEDAEARPARIEVRINELFRGDLDDFVVLRSWDFMLPESDLADVRVLAATGPSLDLMGCGFTRPYSDEDVGFWRETFADGPSEDCGAEVRDCDLGEPSPVPAGCHRESYEYAIHSNIDAGSFPFDVIGCNERFLSLRVNLGDCPPEATKEQRRECAREKTAYFAASADGWQLLTYETETRCESVQALEPTFPTAFCRP